MAKKGKGKSSSPKKADKAKAKGKGASDKAQELSDKDLQKVSGGLLRTRRDR
jgi:bacteriocin-like protein